MIFINFVKYKLAKLKVNLSIFKKLHTKIACDSEISEILVSAAEKFFAYTEIIEYEKSFNETIYPDLGCENLWFQNVILTRVNRINCFKENLHKLRIYRQFIKNHPLLVPYDVDTTQLNKQIDALKMIYEDLENYPTDVHEMSLFLKKRRIKNKIKNMEGDFDG